MDPVEALREIAFWRERARADTHRVRAYRRAADVVEELTPAQRARLRTEAEWVRLPGVGPSTATVITQAMGGRVPTALADARAGAAPILAPDDAGGAELLAAVRGDLHVHTSASDGGSPLAEMAAVALRLGREYVAITDHSPRLTVARGLDADRLRAQLDDVARLNAEIAPLRVLTGIEVDINEDGSLDQEPGLLEELDIVVASVHSELRMEESAMTRRMVRAIANPHVDVLGHCTGRLVEGSRGTRPESRFDAEIVFEACRAYDVAVEINARPERRDPPMRLLEAALAAGCLFSIDSDAHAPGQLDWLGYGCSRAAAAGVPAERVVTTWPVDDVSAWARR